MQERRPLPLEHLKNGFSVPHDKSPTPVCTATIPIWLCTENGCPRIHLQVRQQHPRGPCVRSAQSNLAPPEWSEGAFEHQNSSDFTSRRSGAVNPFMLEPISEKVISDSCVKPTSGVWKHLSHRAVARATETIPQCQKCLGSGDSVKRQEKRTKKVHQSACLSLSSQTSFGAHFRLPGFSASRLALEGHSIPA